MSPQARKPFTGDELRWWLNDRRGREVTLSLHSNRFPGPLLNGKGELGHSSDDFDLAFVNEDPDMAGLYSIGQMVLSVGDLEKFDVWLITAPEYHDVEIIEILVADNVTMRIGDPF